MKSRTIVIKRKYLVFTLILSIAFFICWLNLRKDTSSPKDTIQTNVYPEVTHTKKSFASPTSNYRIIEAYKNMPQNINGYEVLGKLHIPKIELDTYVLAETNKSTLNTSVTKLCGPKVNGIGNFCITGHNYINDKMFCNLRKLEVNDKFFLTDIYENTVEYVIYDIFKVKPEETQCLSQETGGEREVTLITCTTGALKRLIIKAIEIYD